MHLEIALQVDRGHSRSFTKKQTWNKRNVEFSKRILHLNFMRKIEKWFIPSVPWLFQFPFAVSFFLFLVSSRNKLKFKSIPDKWLLFRAPQNFKEVFKASSLHVKSRLVS